MTYQEVQSRLSTVQSALTSLQNGTHGELEGLNIPQSVQQLQEIEENLKTQLNLLQEEEGVVSTDDEAKAEKLAKKGINVRLSEEDNVVLEKIRQAIASNIQEEEEELPPADEVPEHPEAEGDLDVGHQDDEPNMLKKDIYDIAVYAAKLYKQLDKYDKGDGEVDFPHWWQGKVIKAREFISSAQHYLEAEEKQPMIDKLALEGKVNEGRGDLEQILSIIKDRAIDSGFSEAEEAEEVIVAIQDHYNLDIYSKVQEEASANKIKKEYDALVSKMKQLAQHYKTAEGEAKAKIVAALKQHTARKRELEAQLDQAVAGTGRSQELTELSGDQREAIMDLQNILDQAASLGDEAREIVRQSFPRMVSKADAYGAFEFGTSANRYDTTLESIIEEIEEYYDEEEDDMNEGRKDNDALYPDNPRLPNIKNLADKIVSIVKAEAAKGELGYIKTMEELRYQQEDDFERTPEWNKAKGIKSDFDDYGNTDEEYKGKHQGSNYKWPMSKATKDRKEADKVSQSQSSSLIGRLGDKTLKEYTDQSFKGSEVIDDANKRGPDMFGKGIFAELLPKGVASENDAVEALKAHDKSGIKARMGQYAPMFVHLQYHDIEHEGVDYRMHQTQYYNSNFKDRDPDFNPAVSKITLFKVLEKAASHRESNKEENLGTIIVKTDQYVQDLRNLPGLGKQVSETIKEEKSTCCGKCGRKHVKGTKCKTPYLKGKDHCRTR